MNGSDSTNELVSLSRCLKNRRVLVLSGAGISTDSGIPDYRGPESSKKPRNPMRYQQFIGSSAARTALLGAELSRLVAGATGATQRGA